MKREEIQQLIDEIDRLKSALILNEKQLLSKDEQLLLKDEQIERKNERILYLERQLFGRRSERRKIEFMPTSTFGLEWLFSFL